MYVVRQLVIGLNVRPFMTVRSFSSADTAAQSQRRPSLSKAGLTKRTLGNGTPAALEFARGGGKTDGMLGEWASHAARSG